MIKDVKTGKTNPTSNASSAKGLGNPVATALVANEAVKVIPFMIKTAVLLGIAAFAYHKITNRFEKLKPNSRYDAANISDAQAQSRADTIYNSLTMFSNDFDAVERSLAGLNYNAFVKVYNAFGLQKSTLLGGKLNLIEWIRDQFSDYEIIKLSALQNGAFF